MDHKALSILKEVCLYCWLLAVVGGSVLIGALASAEYGVAKVVFYSLLFTFVMLVAGAVLWLRLEPEMVRRDDGSD